MWWLYNLPPLLPASFTHAVIPIPVHSMCKQTRVPGGMAKHWSVLRGAAPRSSSYFLFHSLVDNSVSPSDFHQPVVASHFECHYSLIYLDIVGPHSTSSRTHTTKYISHKAYCGQEETNWNDRLDKSKPNCITNNTNVVYWRFILLQNENIYLHRNTLHWKQAPLLVWRCNPAGKETTKC